MTRNLLITLLINIFACEKTINNKSTLFNIVQKNKIPLAKVAIELNQEIVDKKKIKNINLKNNDKIEIVHFIGGG